jgi:hypothetical protein
MQVGQFQILRRLATGGMGTVYHAVDKGLNREVALKVLQPGAASDPLMRERFLREAQTLAGIDHPNVIPISLVEREGDTPFLVMKFASGGSLQDKLDAVSGHSLPWEEVLEVGTAMASALTAVHAQGLVHRDIKPSNILLGEQPFEIWLGDFGLARGEQHVALTRSHTFLGTPQYMAPEQAEGLEAGPRSDLFSLGSVLYAMASGTPPFAGTEFEELRRAIREDRPRPLRDVAPATPSWLVHIIESLLVKDPLRRPPSAAVLLTRLTRGEDPGTAPSRLLWGRRTRRRRLLRLVFVAALGAMALAAAGLVALEQTGRTHLVNTLLSARHSQPFWIGGQWGTYSTFEEVVNAANANGSPHRLQTVIVHSNATLHFRQVDIQHPLVIRAGKDRAPTLHADEIQDTAAEAGHIRVLAPATFEGLTFHQRPLRFQIRPFFEVPGTSLALRHCRLVRTSRPALAGRSVVRGTLHVTGPAEVQVMNCEIMAVGSPVVAVEGGPDADPDRLPRTFVRLDKSRLFGRALVVQNSPCTVDFHAGNSVFVSTSILECHTFESTVQARVAECVLLTSRQIVWHNTPPRPNQDNAWMTWRGRNNLFYTQGVFARSGNTVQRGLPDWQGYVGMLGGSSENPTQIHTNLTMAQVKDLQIFAGASYPVMDPDAHLGQHVPSPVPLAEVGPLPRRRLTLPLDPDPRSP